jgi:hypothetical protein
MGKALAVLVKKVAEGDFGKPLASVYWKLEGIKTYTAIAFAVAAYALSELGAAGLCEPCPGYVDVLLWIAGGLLAVGLFDGALRTAPPTKQRSGFSIRHW